MGIMRIQNQTGDTELTWDAANPESVALAEQTLGELLGKGHLAYKTDKAGGGEVIKAFDPTADEIVVAVPLVGG